MATFETYYEYDKRIELCPADMEAHSILASLFADAILANKDKGSLYFKGKIVYAPSCGVQRIEIEKSDIECPNEVK